jgi:hypothetical protein
VDCNLAFETPELTANTHKHRHSREGGNPQAPPWIPACAGMTEGSTTRTGQDRTGFKLMDNLGLTSNDAKTQPQTTLAPGHSYPCLGLELAGDETGRDGYATAAI